MANFSTPSSRPVAGEEMRHFTQSPTISHAPISGGATVVRPCGVHASFDATCPMCATLNGFYPSAPFPAPDARLAAGAEPLRCDQPAYVMGGTVPCGTRFGGMRCLCETHAAERDVRLDLLRVIRKGCRAGLIDHMHCGDLQPDHGPGRRYAGCLMLCGDCQIEQNAALSALLGGDDA